MKLASRTFAIFWDVHAWAGIISALVLYVMFFAAPFALFFRDIDDWAEPRAAPTAATATPALQPLLAELLREDQVIGADALTLHLGNTRELRADWWVGDHREERAFAPELGRLVRPRSELGTFLYRLHFLGPLPKGIELAGVAAMAMVLALVTGLLIHLKDVVRQWFQFRPARVLRTWASDLHKVLGVLGLPYQLLFAWTGAMLCLSWATVEPAFTAVLFRGDDRAAAIARGSEDEATAAIGMRSRSLPDLDQLLARARAAEPTMVPETVRIAHVGDEASTVTVSGQLPDMPLGTVEWCFDARGELRRFSSARTATSPERFEAWFFGLHFARFASNAVKVLYALLAFATCAVIVSGNLVWLERRDRGRQRLGNRLLERFTIGIGAGLPVAVSAMFLANRVLPLAVGDRGKVEQTIFWSAWLLSAVIPFVSTAVLRVAASELLLAAAMFAAVPACGAVAHPDAFFSAPHGGVHLAMVGLAAACGWGGLRLSRTPLVSGSGDAGAETVAVGSRRHERNREGKAGDEDADGVQARP